MEEFKKQIIYVFVFVLIMFCFLGYRAVKNIYIGVGKNSGICIKVSDNLCLSADFGAAEDYYEASTICSQKGMKLPSLSDAWDIWISSENCKRAFSSNEEVPKSKIIFMKPGAEEYPYTPARSINNYCKKISEIKFPISSQYKGGLYWLKDSAGGDKHYAINYARAVIYSKDNRTKGIGVRCVYSSEQKKNNP